MEQRVSDEHLKELVNWAQRKDEISPMVFSLKAGIEILGLIADLQDARREIVEREICPNHPYVKSESAYSHTWTVNGQTYFKTRVTYCPECIEVISTDAYL